MVRPTMPRLVMRLVTGAPSSSSTMSSAKTSTTPFRMRFTKVVTVLSSSRSRVPCTRCIIRGPISLEPTRPQASRAIRAMCSALSSHRRIWASSSGGKGSMISAIYSPTAHTKTGAGFENPRTATYRPFLARAPAFSTSQGASL